MNFIHTEMHRSAKKKRNLSNCHHHRMHQIKICRPSAKVYKTGRSPITFEFICRVPKSSAEQEKKKWRIPQPKMQVSSQLLLIALALISIKLSTASQVKTALDNELIKLKATIADGLKLAKVEQAACTCAVFLSGQFKKGSPEPPTGNPALLHEHDTLFPCSTMGQKQCLNKCLETVSSEHCPMMYEVFWVTHFIEYIYIFQLAKQLPNSPNILCASMDRDCHKERAYLFTQSCNGTWVNTNLSAGREYCCKDGVPYKCPLVWWLCVTTINTKKKWKRWRN